jgi:hypothetical protein
MKLVPREIKNKFLIDTCTKITNLFNINQSIIKSNEIMSVNVFTDVETASNIINEVYLVVTKDYNNYVDSELGEGPHDYSLLFNDSFENNKLVISWNY